MLKVLKKVQESQLDELLYSESYLLEDQKETLTSIPTLIIGVGGTGVDALVRTKYLYEKRFKKADRLHFLGIDSEIRKSNESYGKSTKVSLDENNEFYALDGAITEYMADSFSWKQTPIKSFFPDDLILDTGDAGTGAGGYRLAGRFILFKHIENITAKLISVLNDIRNGYDNAGNIKFNIVILTGIGGGTGSGTSLDIAYIIRTILARRFRLGTEDYTLTGYIILPDVNSANRDDKHIESNGYAYLKELDYLKNLKKNQEIFT